MAPMRERGRAAAPTREELQEALPVSGRIGRRLFAIALGIRAIPGAGVALALVCFLAATAARFASDAVLPPGFPFLTFFPAVIVTAFFGGARAGALCGLLGGLAAWYWFIPPFGSFALNRASATAMSFYVLIVVVDIALFHFLAVSIDRLLQQRREMEGMLVTQRTLFSELQHRVANNLAFVSALFGIQRRRFTGNPQAVAAFDDARQRLDTMGRVHRRLYDPANADQPMANLLGELVSDMLSSAGRTDIEVSVDAPEIGLATNARMTLALIVMEISINALKHAFTEKGGRIAIRLERRDGDNCRLVVRDDGPGFPPTQAEAGRPGQSLGLRILQSFAVGLKGELAFTNDGGAVTTLDFEAPDMRGKGDR